MNTIFVNFVLVTIFIIKEYMSLVRPQLHWTSLVQKERTKSERIRKKHVHDINTDFTAIAFTNLEKHGEMSIKGNVVLGKRQKDQFNNNKLNIQNSISVAGN